MQIGEVGLDQPLVDIRIVAFPRKVELFALGIGDIGREEGADLVLNGACVIAQIEFDRDFAGFRQARRFAGIKPPSGLGQPVLGIAGDQRPGLGAQIV